MMRTNTILCVALLFAGAAFAHSGVKNAAVKARMDAMSGIGAEMKILGTMAKGVTVFDQTAARAAAAGIAKHAAGTPVLFEADEDDPKSEAKAEIWTNFDDFVKKSQNLEGIAAGLSTTIASEADLGIAMKSLGASCHACHKAYRE
ncbi:cytochrome c [uncultured Boseongicola sp.]|jgi:cytochrome c556|uniref:c-type cytochrome n=1 Tax=uncultured Boseongicola sp. TaxID=1648499 RepID=UPI0026051774|nr:cytochrome c [uncultured Boseongicola sp.]